MVHEPGSFSWFELSTSDQAGAKRFYGELFGWKADDSPMGPNEFYTTFHTAGGSVAAACTMQPAERQAGVPPHWNLYVAVENADATAARAAELGGKVLAPPFDVMDHGRMAVIEDPTGAYVSIWQPKTHAGTTAAGGDGAVCWADLRTPDQERAGEFYRRLFGWKTTDGSEALTAAKPGAYYHVVNHGEMIGGIQPSHATNPNAPPHWLVYVQVADCAASTARAKALGARAFVENMEIPGTGAFSVFADPQGAVFAIHATKR